MGASISSGPSDGVSDSALVTGAGVVAGAGVGLINLGIFIFGIGIVISGFFVRITSVVVATYSGNAANTKMPNTKPANPCNSARIR